MGRAILALTLIFLLSLGYVIFQLWSRRPAATQGSLRPAQILVPREDGSIYAVSLEMERLERRLMEEEKRSGRLQEEVGTLRRERDDLAKDVDGLQSEVRRLRRQMTQQARPPEPEPEPATPTPPVEPEGTPVPQPEGTGQ